MLKRESSIAGVRGFLICLKAAGGYVDLVHRVNAAASPGVETSCNLVIATCTSG
jgi:hypothetical protein